MATASIVRPRVFLDIQIGTEPAGRLVIELFIDKTPKTCENFRALCTSSSTDKTLTYKLSPLHRVIDEFMIQGGDITKGDGTGGASIYGGEFEDENIGWREMDKEGLVCMANRGKGTNSSQFFITLAACPHLNLKHTIFGHLVSGNSTLTRLASLPVDKNDRPQEPVLISHCGELERRKKATNPETTNTTTKDTTNASPYRGRKGRKRSRSSTRSPSRSLSPDRKHHRKHHRASPPQSPPRHRRRSDHDLDSTLRGRPRVRSSSPSTLPTIPASQPLSDTSKERKISPSSLAREPKRNHHHHHKRRRSPSPSRSRSRNRERSRSPHLRRRHSRSRSWGRARHMGRREEFRDRAEEEAIRREEMEREGGAGRFEGIIEEDRGNYARERVRQRGETSSEGRLGGGGGGDGEGEGEVKFKGRGSMKFRERRW